MSKSNKRLFAAVWLKDDGKLSGYCDETVVVFPFLADACGLCEEWASTEADQSVRIFVAEAANNDGDYGNVLLAYRNDGDGEWRYDSTASVL